MNDRRVNELVRMALEVDDIEREAEGAQALRLVGTSAETPVIRRGWWVGAGLAAAAAVAIAVVVPTMFKSNRPEQNGPIAHVDPTPEMAPGASGGTSNTNAVATVPQPLGEHLHPAGFVQTVSERLNLPGREIQYPMCTPNKGCIVMAIYRDTAGGAPCVRIRPQACSDVTDHDLRCITLGQPCEPTVGRGLVVALSGPPKELPRTESEAMTLASCILGTPHPCDGDAGCFARAAAECVSPDVSVKIETVATNR